MFTFLFFSSYMNMTLTKEQQAYLENIWTDVKKPSSYTGPYKLYQVVKKEGKYKIGLKAIKQFLSDLESYSLQKRVQKKCPRRHILTDSIDSIWDGDLQMSETYPRETMEFSTFWCCKISFQGFYLRLP